MCVTELSSEDVGAPGAMVPLSLDPILLGLEGGQYVGPLLPVPLAEMVSGTWGEIAATHLLDGLSDPRKPPDAQAHTGLDRRLAR